MDNRGGKRIGAGRPKTDRKPITRMVNESEKLAVDKLLSNIRNADTMSLKSTLDLYDQGKAGLTDIALALTEECGTGDSEQIQRAIDIIKLHCK